MRESIPRALIPAFAGMTQQIIRSPHKAFFPITYRFSKMVKHNYRLYLLTATLLAVGCSQSVAPTQLNFGIPIGAKEGQYGFFFNGRHFDDSSLSYRDGRASIQPYVIEGSGAVTLSISLYYNFPDGTRGSIGLSAPLLIPKPHSFQFSDVSSLWNLNAIGSLTYDTGVNSYAYYRSIPGGTLNLTKFDTINNLVSGTFELTAYETSPITDLHNTINISSGYFNDIPILEGSYAQGNITALVNGTPLISDTAGVEMIYADSQFYDIDLVDYGQDSLLDSYISIQRIPLQTGTYKIDSSTWRSNAIPLILVRYWLNNNPPQYFSTQNANTSGSLTITKCDIAQRRISGSFQFSGVDTLGNTVTISNGAINNVRWGP